MEGDQCHVLEKAGRWILLRGNSCVLVTLEEGTRFGRLMSSISSLDQGGHWGVKVQGIFRE